MANLTYTGNLRSQPVWCGDFGGREHVMPFPARIQASAFAGTAGIRVQTNGAAAQGATSVTVDALTIGTNAVAPLITAGNIVIPAGTVLDFGGAKFARLTADAALGATTLAVTALVTALADNDIAVYSIGGLKVIPSGTMIGRTLAERDAGTPFGVNAPTTDDEQYLTYNDVITTDAVADVEVTRHGTLVKENFLPGFADYTTDAKTALRARYQCITGRA
jgi:hypothetical protein